MYVTLTIALNCRTNPIYDEVEMESSIVHENPSTEKDAPILSETSMSDPNICIAQTQEQNCAIHEDPTIIVHLRANENPYSVNPGTESANM